MTEGGRSRSRSRAGAGFTLVELLVVILIILLVSAVTLPVVLPALGNRQVSEAARILQAALAGARDAAIRANERRGIRLVPDAVLATKYSVNANTPPVPSILTYSTILPLEPGTDYTDGAVSIIGDMNTYYSRYPFPAGTNYVYPSQYGAGTPGANTSSGGRPKGQVLRVEECAFDVTITNPSPTNFQESVTPNAPTNWWWNIRVGDKIQINGTGRYYTIVGPLTIFPGNPDLISTPGQPNYNAELFVNDGPPGPAGFTGGAYPIGGIPRSYGIQNAQNPQTTTVEFLYVVNGDDDDTDGFIDDGFDGINNDYLNGTDDVVVSVDANGNPIGIGEWETEVWVGSLQSQNNHNDPTIFYNDPRNPGFNLPYTISRRPLVSPGSREVKLPSSVVIDATTALAVDLSNDLNNRTGLAPGLVLNPQSERSRLPIDPYSLFVDIVIDQSGQVVPTTLYSSTASSPFTQNFYHFWLSDRTDVYDPVAAFFTNPAQGTLEPFPSLPMPQGFATGLPNQLKKERQLVTLFARTGQIVTKSIETFHPPLLLGPSDTIGDVNAPFYESQLGIREAK